MKRRNIKKKPALLSVPRLRLVISVWLLRLQWNQAIHLYSLIDKKSPPGQTCCSSDHKGVRRITCNQRLIGLWNNMKYRIMSLSLTFERPSRQVFATGIFIDPDSIKTNIITFFQMHKGVDLLTKIFTRINQYIFIYFFFFDYSYKQIICRPYLQNSSNLSENASFSTIFIWFYN